MKAIHFVRPKKGGKPVVKPWPEGNPWNSGPWAIPERLAKDVGSGMIFLHEEESEKSYFGGFILGYAKKGNTIVFKYWPDDRAQGIPWPTTTPTKKNGGYSGVVNCPDLPLVGGEQSHVLQDAHFKFSEARCIFHLKITNEENPPDECKDGATIIRVGEESDFSVATTTKDHWVIPDGWAREAMEVGGIISFHHSIDEKSVGGGEIIGYKRCQIKVGRLNQHRVHFCYRANDDAKGREWPPSKHVDEKEKQKSKIVSEAKHEPTDNVQPQAREKNSPVYQVSSNVGSIRNPRKRIHFICRRVNAVQRTGVIEIKGGEDMYTSCCWALPYEEARKVIGGLIFLHEAKTDKSAFGGVVLEAYPVRLSPEKYGITDRVMFKFKYFDEARGRSWPDDDPPDDWDWTSGVIDI